MKILIVEDTDTDALLIKWMLQKVLKALGHVEEIIFERAKNEEDAFRMITQNDYNLITEDGNLENNGRGTNVLYKLDRKFYRIIIGISDAEFLLDYCKENGIAIFHKNDLMKPDPEIKLLPLVEKILKSAA